MLKTETWQNSTPEIKVRPVTEEEIDFFIENGWVRIKNLVDPETAAMLLGRSKREFGDDGRAGMPPPTDGEAYYMAWFRANVPEECDEAFERLASSRELGRNAARLLGRDSSIRMLMHKYLAKLPGDPKRGGPTGYHQDEHPYVNTSYLTAWIALDRVTADMGAMRFYSRSEKLGFLTNLSQCWEGWQERLNRCSTLSDPVELEAGDATFHMNNLVHGAGSNLSDSVRWSWAAIMAPGDAAYTGAKSEYSDGLGLEPLGPLDHPKFPIIYAPD